MAGFKKVAVILLIALAMGWPYYIEWGKNANLFQKGEKYPYYKSFRETRSCYECGYESNYKEVCPKCGSKDFRGQIVREVKVYQDINWWPDPLVDCYYEERTPEGEIKRVDE